MDKKSPDAFRTISEVADWLGVPAHVLRFWESRFAQIKPVKRAGGRRYYRPSDMQLLAGIRKLLHEDGMTIRGVKKLLREQGVKHVAAMSPPLDSDSMRLEPESVPDVIDMEPAAATRESDVTTSEVAAEHTESVPEQPIASEPDIEVTGVTLQSEVPERIDPEDLPADEATDTPLVADTPQPVTPPIAEEEAPGFDFEPVTQGVQDEQPDVGVGSVADEEAQVTEPQTVDAAPEDAVAIPQIGETSHIPEDPSDEDHVGSSGIMTLLTSGPAGRSNLSNGDIQALCDQLRALSERMNQHATPD